MAAARVAVLLNLFTVKAQQIGADIVDLVDIVAVFFKAVNQPGADFLAFRRLEIGLQDLNQLVKAERCCSKTIPFSACRSR
jgi:hypothetical protein